jgi:hypothetical protein
MIKMCAIALTTVWTTLGYDYAWWSADNHQLQGNRVIAFVGIECTAELRLDLLDVATSVLDLDLPGNGWKH